MLRTLRWLVGVLSPSHMFAVKPTPPDRAGIEFYEKHGRPLLVTHCYAHHSADANKLYDGLRLDWRAAWLKGGNSDPLFVAGAPEKSNRIHAMPRNHADIAAMPPAKPLADEHIKTLIVWVCRGAPAPDDGTTPGWTLSDRTASVWCWTYARTLVYPRPVLSPYVARVSWLPRSSMAHDGRFVCGLRATATSAELAEAHAVRTGE